jgi:hypothetical protein
VLSCEVVSNSFPNEKPAVVFIGKARENQLPILFFMKIRVNSRAKNSSLQFKIQNPEFKISSMQSKAGCWIGETETANSLNSHFRANSR